MKQAIFFLALPGAGKSTLITERGYDRDFEIISADDIKQTLPDYDPLKPELVHERSVELAEQMVYNSIKNEISFCMDGGGVNNSYTLRIMSATREAGYHIHLIYLNVPVAICVERIKNRERKVPIEEVISKSLKIKDCFLKQRELANEIEVINYHSDKYLFLDMDGVLAEYQTITTLEYDMDYVNTKIFENAKPVKEVIAKIQNLLEQGLVEKVFILSASPNSITNEQKLNWINKHLPFPVIPYFVGNKKHKVVMLKQLLRKHKIDPKDCLHVDDLHEIIWEAVKLGVNAIHPSKFLTDY